MTPAPAVEFGLPDEAAWEADVLAVAVRGGEPAGAHRAGLDRLGGVAAARYGIDLDAVLAAEKVTGRAGEVVRVPVLAPPGLPARLLLVGTGLGSAQDLRRAGAALGRVARGRRLLAVAQPSEAGDGLRAFVEGIVLGGHSTPASGLKPRADSRPVPIVRLIGTGRSASSARAVRLGLLVASATTRARDLASTPSNLKNPAWVAEQAALAAAESGLGVEIWDEHRLADEGFGGLLAVGAASPTPPRLVRLDYTPPPATGSRPATARRPVVLVGKGITFDTGGLSIKSREAMLPMKTDMSGAAVVLAVLASCRDLGVRRRVVGLLALAENAVGGAAYRPSDVVRQFGGRTVEVTNTDAEGRMVLADALSYADAVLDPATVVDIATLTGAASQGLGKRHAALFATDDRLAAALQAASVVSGEPVWRLPLVEDYAPALDSDVADLRHVARNGKVGGGAIVAALFLREFAGHRPWAHLDVAGPSRADRDEHEVGKGATGYGARLLLRWLEGLR